MLQGAAEGEAGLGAHWLSKEADRKIVDEELRAWWPLLTPLQAPLLLAWAAVLVFAGAFTLCAFMPHACQSDDGSFTGQCIIHPGHRDLVLGQVTCTSSGFLQL